MDMNTMKAYKRSAAVENSTWYKGILSSQLAIDSETNGAFDLIEGKMRKGTEPPPHVYDREDEMFYILSGEIKVFAEGQVFDVCAGESVFLPRKAAHAYLIESEEVHLLALMTPGGFFGAINKMNKPARAMEIPSDMETYATVDLTATMAVFAKFGVQMLSPGEIAEQMPAYLTAR
jgi:quercetin dioxygenase-like cupin family protein